MADLDFQETFDKLKKEVIKIATSAFKDYKKEAKKDAEKMVDQMKVNLQRWTLQLGNGELSKDDFKFLILGQKELIEMKALEKAGETLIRIDDLKRSILNSIIKITTGL